MELQKSTFTSATHIIASVLDQTLPPIQNTPREKPQGVFGVRCSVCTITCTQPACVTLVNTSVYLKPTKLLNVALDVLAGLAPCLNLGVGELRHKDLLDTIGADNRRK